MHSIHKNLLPIDGRVNYYDPIFKPNESNLFFQDLMESIEWKHDELKLFGKKIITKRKVAWYGDKPFSYQYSNTNKQALAWTETLKIIKNNKKYY